jgi:peptidoglycan/LPS O-acetylase OafA/YrhL
MSARNAPPAVRSAALVTYAHAVLHLTVPPIMSAQRAWFVDHFARLNRSQPADFAQVATETLLRASLIYHLVLASLFVVLAAFVVRRKNWARWLLTIVLILGAFGTAISFSSPTPNPFLYKTLNVVSWLLACGALALLWASASARQFFTSRQ